MKNFKLTKTQEVLLGGTIFIVGISGIGLLSIVIHSILKYGF